MLCSCQKMFPTCKYYGLDPSQQGIDEGNNYPNNTISFSVGTCDDINIYENDKFHLNKWFVAFLARLIL